MESSPLIHLRLVKTFREFSERPPEALMAKAKTVRITFPTPTN
jgi:hypothetical protein